MGNRWRAFRSVLGGFCAAFLCYVVIGGLTGFAFGQPFFVGAPCLPHNSTFGVLEAHCETALANTFWLLAAEIPRLVLVFPALAVTLIRASILNHFDSHYALESVPWMAYSMPLALMSWAGFRHMRTRSSTAAHLAIVLLMGEILFLAWRE